MPLARRRARAPARATRSICAGAMPELGEQRVDRAPRIPGVVLEAREALLGGAADDPTVAEDGRGRAVRLGDPEDDHVPGSIRLARRPVRGARYASPALAPCRRLPRADALRRVMCTDSWGESQQVHVGPRGASPSAVWRSQDRSAAGPRLSTMAAPRRRAPANGHSVRSAGSPTGPGAAGRLRGCDDESPIARRQELAASLGDGKRFGEADPRRAGKP